MSPFSASGRRALAGAHAVLLAPVVALTLAGVVPPKIGWMLVCSLALAVAYHAACALRQAGRRRAEADRLLVAIDAEHVPDALRWRARELTTERERRILARALANLLRSLELPPTRAPIPVNRRAVIRNRGGIEALVARLRAFDRPVRPRGIILVRELLRDGLGSPLYDLERAETELRAVLVRVHSAIEPF